MKTSRKDIRPLSSNSWVTLVFPWKLFNVLIAFKYSRFDRHKCIAKVPYPRYHVPSRHLPAQS